MEIVRYEGNRRVKRNINIYNLDMIISVGYRVNSVEGIKFRRWANKIYHLGHSIKDLGKKIFSISQSDSNLIPKLLSNIYSPTHLLKR